MHTGGGAEEEIERMAAVMDAEVRAEQAAYEAMALQAQWRSRTLADVAREHLVRGDVIEVALPGHRFNGTVTQAGEDVLLLRTRNGVVDVALARCDLVRVVRHVRSGGHADARGARTWRARMTEHEVAVTRLRLLVRGVGEVEGTIAAVAVDHLVLDTTRGQAVVPGDAVLAAWPVP